jgi:hypothetical protein
MIRVAPSGDGRGFAAEAGRGLIAEGVRANDPLEQEVIDHFGSCRPLMSRGIAVSFALLWSA